MSDSIPTANAATTRTEVPSDPALEALPIPAAVLDTRLRLLRANARFLALCLEPRPNVSLALLLPAASSSPLPVSDGCAAEYLGRAAGDLPVEVSYSRRGENVGVVAKPVVVGDAAMPLAEAMHALADQGRVREALLNLSREVALAACEEELVASIARCVRLLFPNRFFCVRIVDPRTHALTSLYAEGRLLEEARGTLAMRRSAAEKAHLNPAALDAKVSLTEQEPLIFAGATRGFATPLAAAGHLFGLLNLEYPQGLTADLARDEKLLIQLANQAAIGVRNAKLIEELTYVKRYLEDLIENANALIVGIDSEGKVRIFNRAASQLSGYERSEIVGRSILDLVVPAERPRIAPVLMSTLQGEPVSPHETLIQTKDAREVRVAFSAAAIPGLSGEADGVIAVGHDITRQKELERRIVQAEKLASLGQLAAGVAHEINNPLTTINMFADALLQAAPGRFTEPDLDKLRRMRESADRILKFARDLTSYARPAQDKPETLDLHHVLDQASRYCDHAVKESNAILCRRYGTVPAIRGVRANLVQVFVNLLTNACHALPGEGGTVEVWTRARDRGVEVDVVDNGKGIDAQHLARIFEPFFTTKSAGRGTGLGLSIVQGIVEKHGGNIAVTSSVGQGTRFSVWLPVEGEQG